MRPSGLDVAAERLGGSLPRAARRGSGRPFRRTRRPSRP
jgi:hypothetical protein